MSAFFAVQMLDTCVTEKEAAAILAAYRCLDGFLGGRVIRGKTVQSFWDPKTAHQGIGENMRVCLIPESQAAALGIGWAGRSNRKSDTRRTK